MPDDELKLHPVRPGPINGLIGDIRKETRGGIVKWTAAGLLGGVAAISGLVAWAAYERYLEPRLARHLAEIITKEDHFERGRNPLDGYIASSLVRGIGTTGGVHADSVQAVDFKVDLRRLEGDDPAPARSNVAAREPISPQPSRTENSSSPKPEIVALVHKGQKVRVILLNLELTFVENDGKTKKDSIGPDDKIDLVLQCSCLKERRLRLGTYSESDGIEEFDITNDIKWTNNNTNYRIIKMAIEAVPGMNARFLLGATVVAIVHNALDVKPKA